MRNKAIIGLIGALVIGLTLFFILPRHLKSSETLYSDLEKINQDSLKAVKGEYFLLHFWAKWCEPCVDEIPELVQFARRVHEQPFKKPLKILAISLDPTLEESMEILPDQGRSLPPNFYLALDADHQFAKKIGSYQYPETYFVNPEGEILEKWVGVQKWLQPQVFEFFRQKVL